MLDAIGRTLVRLFVSRRHLLEWTTAAQANSRRASTGSASTGQMAGSLLIASLAALAVWQAGRAALPVAAPFILAWLLVARDRALGQPAAGRCRQPGDLARPMPRRCG